MIWTTGVSPASERGVIFDSDETVVQTEAAAVNECNTWDAGHSGSTKKASLMVVTAIVIELHDQVQETQSPP